MAGRNGTNLTERAKEFAERGLLIIEDFFDTEKIDEIDSELQRFISEIDPEEMKGRIVYEANGDRKIRNIFHLNETSDYFAELARATQFSDLCRAIFDDEPVPLSVELFAKPAHVGSEVPYHQDNAYFNLIPAQALTCWVALADATRENGCVRYIVGSHKLGNLPHHASGVKGNSMGLSELPTGAGQEVCGIVRRGGALIHDCNTIHRSDPNRSDSDRPGLLFVYKASRCRIDAKRAEKYREVATITNV
jgi:ectoine hydroxylase-related dioxygenase (phytanoyl-CoA dioxygenase family)